MPATSITIVTQTPAATTVTVPALSPPSIYWTCITVIQKLKKIGKSLLTEKKPI